MVLKKRTNPSNSSTIDKLANELSDRPYGTSKIDHTMVRTTINIPKSMLFELEDTAQKNRRSNESLRSVSALIRNCIEKNFYT